MKKLISLLMIIPLVMIVSVGIIVQASTSDEDLAKLLEQLEKTAAPVVPTANPKPPVDTGGVGTGNGDIFETQSLKTPPPEHEAAEAILDSTDSDKWAYTGPEKITVKDVTTTGATIVTSQVTYDGKPVTKYQIYYSDKTLATIQDFNLISNVIVEVKKTDGTNVELLFENLSPNKTYYIVVVPVHPTDPTQEPLGFMSDEVTFDTAQQVATPTEKVFTNVSYTYKDSSITLTWTPSSAAPKADIQLRHQSEATYTKVGTPALQDGKFSFKVSKSGTYFLKMTAMDATSNPVGQEHIQTVKIDEVEKTTAVQAAPQVGPTTNIMIGLLFFAVLVYFVSRFRRIER